MDAMKLKYRRTDEKHAGGNYYYYYCKACEEVSMQTGESITKIIGRRESFIVHLKRCPNQSTSTITNVAPSTNSNKSSISTFHGSAESMASSSVASIQRTKQQKLSPYLDQGFTENQIYQFENLFAEFVADNGIALHCVERQSRDHLFRFIREVAAESIPRRKKLGTIMKRVADASRIPRIQGFERDVQNGRIVNIVMDGWES